MHRLELKIKIFEPGFEIKSSGVINLTTETLVILLLGFNDFFMRPYKDVAVLHSAGKS